MNNATDLFDGKYALFVQCNERTDNSEGCEFYWVNEDHTCVFDGLATLPSGYHLEDCKKTVLPRCHDASETRTGYLCKIVKNREEEEV